MYDVERDNLRRPPPPSERTPGGSFLPIVMVLVVLAIMIVGIVAFTGLAGLLALAVIAALPAFMLLHYLLWGYWLGKSIREADQPEDDEEPGD